MDIAAWLRGLGLERYAQAFEDAEVTLEVLPELTEADLRELGLPLGPRKTVLKAIQALALSTAPEPVETRASPTSQIWQRRRSLTGGNSRLCLSI